MSEAVMSTVLICAESYATLVDFMGGGAHRDGVLCA
jgi:hypothetical protein